MVPLAVVIERTFSGCDGMVIGGGPLLNRDSGRGWRTGALVFDAHPAIRRNVRLAKVELTKLVLKFERF